MTLDETLKIILDRLGCSVNRQAIFSFDEAKEWSPDAVDTFIVNGILQKTQPATILTCDGCEEYCTMPVKTLRAEGKRPTRTFIACGGRSDVGCVTVDQARLKQWQISIELLAKALTKALNLAVSPIKNSDGKGWTLGLLKGRKNSQAPVLRVENGIFIDIAGYPISLMEILTFENGRLLMDKNELIKCVNKPKKLPITAGYKPSSNVREKGKMKTQEQYAKWKKAYKTLKNEHKDKSDRWIAIKISNQKDIANGKSFETIRDHMK